MTTPRAVAPTHSDADDLVVDRFALADLHAEYAAALDDGEFARWPSFFTEDCSYSITTKENVQRGWDLCLLSCESRGALIDRVSAIEKTMFYLPRAQRRIVSGIRVLGATPTEIRTSSSFAVFEALLTKPTTLFATGCFLDVVRPEGGSLRFAERTCILDSSIVPESLPFPL